MQQSSSPVHKVTVICSTELKRIIKLLVTLRVKIVKFQEKPCDGLVQIVPPHRVAQQKWEGWMGK